MMRKQRGSVGALVLLIMVLVIVSLIALAALNRTTSIAADRDQTTSRLDTAVAALDSYAATAMRLPCPADPALDTGDEVQATPSSCSFPTGTLPWRTIGMRREEAFDAWGLKLSYRVYTGAGSLTQPGGVSMVNCDSLEALPGGLTADGANNSGRLCNPDANTANRNTTPAFFLANKGLQLTDLGTVHNDVAYVVISHGATGLGGWTVAGVQRDLPSNGGAERDNTRDTGPFMLQAFSDLETKSTSNAHFDDLVAYRTLPDLVKRANLSARNWPDDVLASVVFDRNTVEAALGSNPGADTGTATLNFNNATVRAFDTSGAQNISFESSGTDSIGGVGGGSGLASTGGEGLQIDFAESARQFAFTLDDFGYQGSIFGFPVWIERVELRFYTVVSTTATLVNTVVKSGCHADGGLASFTVDPGVDFQRVEIRPLATTNFFGTQPTTAGLAEIRTCAVGVTCQTSLQTAGNLCP